MLAELLLAGAAVQASPSRGDENWPLCARSDAEQAIVACTSLIRERGPEIALALYNRAIAYRQTRQFDRALADLNRVIQLRADFTAAYVERGIVRYEMRNYIGAIADADAAIHLKSDLAEGFNNRALARLKLGQYDLATADFNRTIRLHQYYGNALINRSLGPLEPTH